MAKTRFRLTFQLPKQMLDWITGKAIKRKQKPSAIVRSCIWAEIRRDDEDLKQQTASVS